MPKADDSLIAALIQKMDERNALASKTSLTQWSAVKKLMALKDIVIGVGFFLSLIGGAFIIFQDLRSKPDLPEVHEAIELRVKPIESITNSHAESIKQVKADVGEVKVKVDRIENVQDYQLEQSAWEAKVLAHLAGKKGPQRPEALEAKERELIKQ